MYDKGYRQAAISLYHHFGNMKKVATCLHIGLATIWRWVNFGIEFKKRTPLPFPKVLLDVITQFINLNNHCVHIDVIQHVHKILNIKVSRKCIATAFRLIGITRKRLRNKGCSKNMSNHQARINDFKTIISNSNNNIIVSLDEVGFDQRHTPIYGYSKKGTKAIATTHPSRRKRTNVIMAIDKSGKNHYEMFDESTTSLKFRDFISNMPWPNGTTIIMDNVAFHKSHIVRNICLHKGYAIAFIPPYSPDYNPIENVFSVVKNTYRKLNLDHSLKQHDIIRTSIANLPTGLYTNCFNHWDKICKST